MATPSDYCGSSLQPAHLGVHRSPGEPCRGSQFRQRSVQHGGILAGVGGLADTPFQAELDVVVWPAKVLETRATEVTQFDEGLHAFPAFVDRVGLKELAGVAAQAIEALAS